MDSHLQAVIESIKKANKEGALFSNGILTGYSGEALCGALQRISQVTLNATTSYVEVGVFQGLTLLSSANASKNNSFFGIDNFAFFDKDGKNKQIVQERIQKLGLDNVTLINEDYENALENLSEYIGDKKVGVYFVDGPHDYRSQLMCLLLIKPFLADRAVILIDDSNYRHVRQANRDFMISHPEFKLLYESYTEAHPMNLDSKEQQKARKGWWNGVNIIYKDTANELATCYPKTLRNRSLYENEHILHSTKYPQQILLLWKLAKSLNLFPLLNRMKKNQADFVGEYQSMNTYSSKLPTHNFNPSLTNDR